MYIHHTLDTALGITAIFCIYGAHFDIQNGGLISNFYFFNSKCTYMFIQMHQHKLNAFV